MTAFYKDEVDIEAATRPRQSTESKKQTNYLDGLRGVAALIVYLSHNVAWWYGPTGPIEHGFGYNGEYMLATFPILRLLFSGGAAAVAVFFVMSGYVLSTSPSTLIRAGDAHKVRSYLLTATIRRPFRLFLPVAMVSMTFALCMHLPFGFAVKLSWPESQETVTAELWKWVKEFGWVMNIFAKHGTFEHWFPYNPPVWTMSAEMKGSLAVYAFLFTARTLQNTHRFRLSLAVGTGLLLIGQWEMAAFMFGIALATIDTNGTEESQIIRPLRSICYHLLVLISLLILGQPNNNRDPEISFGTPGWYSLTRATSPIYFRAEFWRFWNVVGATLLIYAMRNIHWLQHLLQRPTVRFLGKISFCLYLIHMPMLWSISDRVARMLGTIRFDFTTPYDNILRVPDLGPKCFSTGFLLWQAIVLPINLFVATQATKIVDQPSIKLSRWLIS